MGKLFKILACSCALSSFGMLSVIDAHAQAYVRQVSPGDSGAYIRQTPPSARPMQVSPAPVRQARTSAIKTRSPTQKTAFRPFPSVGQGSTAIVQPTSDSADWPTVGRGAVNK